VNYVVDDIGTVVAQMKGAVPEYLFGHRLEINNRLLKQSQDPAKKEQRYPLIALFLDIEQSVTGNIINYKLNIMIVTKTNPNDTTEARYDDMKPFKMVLYPLYYSFIQSLSDSGLFMWPTVADMPKHSKIDRPFWGKAVTDELGIKKTEANVFNDYLDAIQIKNLEINQKLKTC
jgi:hypothetical protein